MYFVQIEAGDVYYAKVCGSRGKHQEGLEAQQAAENKMRV